LKKIILTSDAPKPLGPYSQAVETGGFVFVSGQLAMDPKAGKIVAQNIAGQTSQVMENIKAILKEADCSLTDVVQVNVYLADLNLMGEFNAEYSKYFITQAPARTTIGANLPQGALIEISAIASKQK
jgi:2-iminobutanoate/2-iminopropanoate deaminase